MRAVIAPFNRIPDTVLAELRAVGHDVFSEGADSLTYAEIESRYPAGWKPEAFLFASPEYNSVPEGLENASCFKAAMIGDWNLGGQVVQQIACAFDLLLADTLGTDRLRSLGFNAQAAQLFSFVPTQHRRIPGIERDLDIVLVGNFNHDIQRERARWLGRVARLSTKYQVLLTGGVYGEAYAELMNRAKIVFNRSIRGEINMRAYEGPACGALLFYERENPEIRSLFADRRECVLYGEDDLEELLEYYLTHDAERQAIADAGYARVQQETPAHHLKEMLDIMERELHSPAKGSRARVDHHLPLQEPAPTRRVGSKRAAKLGLVPSGPGGVGTSSVVPFLACSQADRELRRARQWLLSSDMGRLGAADAALERAESEGAETSDVGLLRGYLLAQAGKYVAEIDRAQAWQEAAAQWNAVLALEPGRVCAHLNLSALHHEMGDTPTAEQHALAVLQLLPTSTAKSVPHTDTADNGHSVSSSGVIRHGDLYWPCRFSEFGVEQDLIEMTHRPNSAGWSASMVRLLRCRALAIAADLAIAAGRFQSGAALAAEAADLVPGSAPSHYRLGRALNALGFLTESATCYRDALAINPFLAEARNALAHCLNDSGHASEAVELMDEWRAIIMACPSYEPHRGECERLRSVAIASTGGDATYGDRHRLLAFPDWTRPASWQCAVRTFCSRAELQGGQLMLWAEPGGPAAPALLRNIAEFLEVDLSVDPSRFPQITIVSQNLRPDERWKLVRAADAILATGPSPAAFQDAIAAADLPIFEVESAHIAAA